ncbi:uncharacterized protein LOC141850739 isoform X2 [Brevipalpus obovatus]|uniref:uncharacterized protein LOC141850739 isoform X2 n=1 Tax=Brevipalpus obovatus TaxID=246614 RepID=UPI003D9F2E36
MIQRRSHNRYSNRILKLISILSYFQITLGNYTWLNMNVNDSPDSVGPVAVLIRKDKEKDRELFNSLMMTTESSPTILSLSPLSASASSSSPSSSFSSSSSPSFSSSPSSPSIYSQPQPPPPPPPPPLIITENYGEDSLILNTTETLPSLLYAASLAGLGGSSSYSIPSPPSSMVDKFGNGTSRPYHTNNHKPNMNSASSNSSSSSSQSSSQSTFSSSNTKSNSNNNKNNFFSGNNRSSYSNSNSSSISLPSSSASSSPSFAASSFPSLSQPTPISVPTFSSTSPSSTINETTSSLQTASTEHRLRWIDYRNRPAYPPRVPPLSGIPSGFRNPITPSNSAPPPASIPQAPLVHTPPFGGSSSNPVGFAGSLPASPSASSSSFSFYPNGNGMARKPGINLTRVEHISAECSDDYMKVVTVFNGTFTGLIYSAGYVHDPNCVYVNRTGSNRFDFYIRLNQCGTLGRQEMYHPKRPGELRRRDQVMWNTLSIQYNPLIEEEWDEHYRVTCEYGSDFWKTVTFPSINVEVNTGSPVVFTINPPQCQMEIRRGFGTAGTRTSGPVTVGDPLTLLIHMKSEKAGFDILVKNCIAHNGANQRLQLIDTNGCVTNEKLISPFRGTYNTDDGHQVTLYAYLKAFRFTGSPALYLECDIHMCHNKCPPQRCYWRNLSKRDLTSVLAQESNDTKNSVVSESISLFQALEVLHDGDRNSAQRREAPYRAEMNPDLDICMPINRIALFVVSLMLVVVMSISMSVCSWVKLRRLRKDQRCVNEPVSYKSNSSSSIPPYRPHSPRY